MSDKNERFIIFDKRKVVSYEETATKLLKPRKLSKYPKFFIFQPENVIFP